MNISLEIFTVSHLSFFRMPSTTTHTSLTLHGCRRFYTYFWYLCVYNKYVCQRAVLCALADITWSVFLKHGESASCFQLYVCTLHSAVHDNITHIQKQELVYSQASVRRSMFSRHKEGSYILHYVLQENILNKAVVLFSFSIY